MPLKLPQKWQSKRQWKKLVIWYKIRLQKKLAKVASTLEDKKKIHSTREMSMEICKPPEKRQQIIDELGLL